MNARRAVAVIVSLAVAAASLLGAAPAGADEVVPFAAASAGDRIARPFGSHLLTPSPGSATAPGSVATADAETAKAYDAWKKAYLKQGCGTGLSFVDASSSTSSMVVSEGQGYGMVITASMAGHDPAARTVFDSLYRYVLAHPSSLDPRLMAWHQDSTCADYPGSDSSATDGDLDIAFGLLLADTQWGSAGAIDYAGEAREIIAALKRSAMNPQTRLPLLGDWVGPSSPFRTGTRTSDLMIGHFRAFEAASGDPFWGEAADASLALVSTLQKGFAASTGLLPDFAVDTATAPRPAPANYLESVDDGAYSWNACRTPWRLAAAGLLADDPAAREAAGRMGAWAVTSTAGAPSGIRAGYRLDGTPLVGYSDPAFLAPLAAGAAVASNRQAWVTKAWSLLRDGAPAGYYSDSVRLQVMLLLSNNSWQPTTRPDSGFTRLGGADRFVVSAAVSAARFPPGTATVYIASGENFPDALSASSAAGARGAPVLLVRKGEVPAPVAAELARLRPARIIVLGGVNSIGAGVLAQLGDYAGTVQRLGGADRFVVSAAVSASVFAPGRPVVYVASGETFPDALAGSAVAGHDGSPVLLVRRDGVPTPVATELRRLKPAAIVLLGGPAAVSDATLTHLTAIAPTTRVSGSDRYVVAASVATRTFPSPGTGTVFVASGATFPDALSGSAAAIAARAPVLLVTPDGIPPAIAAELTRLAPRNIVLLGGPAAVSPATEAALRDYLAPGSAIG